MAGWITLTSLIWFQFIHGWLIHLVLNCSGLIGIGSLLEKSIGTKNYMYLFVISTALIVASAMVFYQPNVRLIGISWFVFAILGFLIPFVYRIWLWKPLWVFLIIAVVSEIPFMFITPWVSALAHISGFIAGLLGFLTFNWRYWSNFFIHTKTLVTQVKELWGTLDREIPLAVRTMVSIYDK